MAIIITSRKARQFVEKMGFRLDEDVVCGIGGGQVAEEAKLVAQHLKKPLYLLPTVLSCDAFWCSSVAVRKGGGVVIYEPTPKPTEVRFFAEVLKQADIRFHQAGWGDILSCYTAAWTIKRTKDPQEVLDKHLNVAKGWVQRVCCPDTDQNRKVLFDTLSDEVTYCDLIGSSEIEEGLEHRIAYYLEEIKISKELLHGEQVMVGMLLMARWWMSSREFQEISDFITRVGKEFYLRMLKYSDDLYEQTEVQEIKKKMEKILKMTVKVK